jgi:hypothetical protein
MLQFLVDGVLAPPGEGPPTGAFEAFRLWGRWLHGRSRPALRADALAELAALWASHHAEIEAATPAGETPWVCAALREADAILARPAEEGDA